MTLVHPRASNTWLFHRYRWDELASVDRWRDSTSTMEREELEQVVVAEYRQRRHRSPLGEWSELTDPFEPAGWADWSPVRSVAAAAPKKTGAVVAATAPARQRGSGTRAVKVEDIPDIRERLRSWRARREGREAECS